MPINSYSQTSVFVNQLDQNGIKGHKLKDCLTIINNGKSQGLDDVTIFSNLNNFLGINIVNQQATNNNLPQQVLDAFISDENNIAGFKSQSSAIESMNSNLNICLSEGSDIDGSVIIDDSIKPSSLSAGIADNKLICSIELNKELKGKTFCEILNLLNTELGNSYTVYPSEKIYTPRNVTECIPVTDGYTLGEQVTLASREADVIGRQSNRDSCLVWSSGHQTSMTVTGLVDDCTNYSPGFAAFSACITLTMGK